MQKSRKPSNDSFRSNIQFALLALAVLMAAVLLRPSTCLGQDLPDLEPCPTPQLVTVEHDGEPGLWFERETARCMLGRVAAVPEYAAAIRRFEQRLLASDERREFHVRRYELAVEGEERAVGALESAVRGRREAEEALGAWHRSRALWFALGALAAGVLVALTAYALDRVRE
jgi:hypothetical protein